MANTEPTPPASPDEPAKPAADANADDDRGYEVPSRTWLVHGAIIVAFALFISMVALLFTRWWTGASVPNAVIEFVGDERMAGVQVRIDGPNLDAANTQKLAAENDYRARFPVPAGSYLVRITRGDTLLANEGSVTVRESDAPRYDLTRLINPAATNPASATTQPQ